MKTISRLSAQEMRKILGGSNKGRCSASVTCQDDSVIDCYCTAGTCTSTDTSVTCSCDGAEPKSSTCPSV